MRRHAGADEPFVGGTHFGNGWPGTGGHPWSGQGLVPGGVAAFSWASTLSVSSYWAHPGAPAGFPAAELAWMAVSPLALAGLVGGAGALVRRTELPAGRPPAAMAMVPAIWTSYAQARGANAGAYASAAAFAANDVVTHAPALARVPVRVAAGHDDPFYPGVLALARALPAGAVVDLGKGCHTDAFFGAQQPPSLAFLARHLAGLPGRCAGLKSRHREQRPLISRLNRSGMSDPPPRVELWD